MKYSNNYVQASNAQFGLIAGIGSVSTPQTCVLNFVLDSSILSKVSSPITITNDQSYPTQSSISCSLISGAVSCQMSCLSSTVPQTFFIYISASSNPDYQKQTYVTCNLYNYPQGTSNPISTMTFGPISGVLPNYLDNSNSYGNGYTGSLNIAYFCMKMNISLSTGWRITISNVLLSSTSSTTASLNGATINSLSLVSASQVTSTVVMNINSAISANIANVLCIIVTDVQSSTTFPSNNALFSIASSDSYAVAIAGNTYLVWSPNKISKFSYNVSSSTSYKVGDSQVTYKFSLRSIFTINELLYFQINNTDPNCQQNIKQIQINNLGVFSGCSTNCICTFQLLESAPMTQGLTYDIQWLTFTNTNSFRPIEFDLIVYSGTKPYIMESTSFYLAMTITADLTLSSFTISSVSPSTTTIGQISNYILTISSPVKVGPSFYIAITFPSNLVPQSSACTNCVTSGSTVYILDSTNSLYQGQAYQTIPFKLTNPSCYGATSFQIIATTYSKLSTDSPTYGYLSSNGTQTFSITYTGVQCSQIPTISASLYDIGAQSTLTVNYANCNDLTNSILDQVELTIPSAFSFSSTSATCTQVCASNVPRECTQNNQKVTIKGLQSSSSGCSKIIYISSVINPLLAGPTSSFGVKITSNNCGYYETYPYLDKIINPSTTQNLYSAGLVMGSYINEANTYYNFTFKICTSCLISQSTQVSTTVRIQWENSADSTCNCASPQATTPAFSFDSSGLGYCTFSLGTTSVTTITYTISLTQCINPISTKVQRNFKIILFQKDNSANYYQSFTSSTLSSPQTTTPFSISLLSNYKVTNNPSYPRYISSNSIYYINIQDNSNVASATFTLLNLNKSSSAGQISISLINDNIIQSQTSIQGSSVTFSSFKPSNSQLKLSISNWFKNIDTLSQYNNQINYGIQFYTYDSLGGIMGGILLKPTISCNFPCKTCNSDSTCIDCYSEDSIYYLLQQSCVLNCSTSSSQKFYTSGNTCKSCSPSCDTCSYLNGNIQCQSCQGSLFLQETSCVNSCSYGYISDSKLNTCISQSTTSMLDAFATGNAVPFPFIIVTIAMIFFAFVGHVRDPNSFIISNILLQVSSLLTIAFLVQLILSAKHPKGIYSIVTSIIGLIAMLALNVIYFILFYRSTRNDELYVKWKETKYILSKIIIALKLVLSFHNSRLYYSRYLGFNLFSCKFSDYKTYWSYLNIISLISIVSCYIPIIIGDVIGIIYIQWTTQLNITLLETLILSVMIIILILYEYKVSRLKISELMNDTEDSSYLKLEDESMIKKNEIDNLNVVKLQHSKSDSKLPVKELFLKNLSKSESMIDISKASKIPTKEELKSFKINQKHRIPAKSQKKSSVKSPPLQSSPLKSKHQILNIESPSRYQNEKESKHSKKSLKKRNTSRSSPNKESSSEKLIPKKEIIKKSDMKYSSTIVNKDKMLGKLEVIKEKNEKISSNIPQKVNSKSPNKSISRKNSSAIRQKKKESPNKLANSVTLKSVNENKDPSLIKPINHQSIKEEKSILSNKHGKKIKELK